MQVASTVSSYVLTLTPQPAQPDRPVLGELTAATRVFEWNWTKAGIVRSSAEHLHHVSVH